MRILYLAQRVPYPPDRGDKIKTYYEISHLAQSHEVVVACLADGCADLANVGPLRRFVAAVDAFPLSRRRARWRALRALFTGSPFTVAYFNEPELHERVADRLAKASFDAIIVYSSGMAQFVATCTHLPRIMQFTDLDSLKWQQYAACSLPPMSWVYRREFRRLLAYERRIAAAFDHSLVCTPRELRDFRSLIPGVSASCAGNGVDLDYFQPRDTSKKPQSLIFTGVMDYFPNVEGAVWFCREILPLIRREVPDVTFTICGSRPNAAVRALQKLPGVTVTGRVPDIRPFLAQACVGVVPLRIARGIQNKVLEALAMGLPVVASTAVCEGVEATRGTDLLVADEPTDFAAAVVRLLRDSGLRTRMGEAARACVEAHYRWEDQLATLDHVLARVTQGRAQVVSGS
jgi:sugar transferase (PEP-CTERM/EpsH1 system associated)